MMIIFKYLGGGFSPLYNNFIISFDTCDATAARYREDAADAIDAKGRMADVDGDVDDAVAATVAKYHEDVAGATAAKSRAETVADDDVVADGVVVVATVAMYREDAAGAIAARIDQNA
ncbi:hypothetical protein QNH48_17945 [Neobacillus sp. YX16]|uniref:hypothetical protein n=1 Tax=Neobacillus sp. YX16 TaxID=3047874 RepID=UPI0024C34809|nr:hypothetical protein [Neobacillus sp. YX16]WHZ00922.1 hypothetical protein QNH48_17945 [Neobacillus sp. YX16]